MLASLDRMIPLLYRKQPGDGNKYPSDKCSELPAEMLKAANQSTNMLSLVSKFRLNV